MATTLTATAQPQFSQVILRAEITTFGPVFETIERSADGGATWTQIRVSPVESVGADLGISTLWIAYAVDIEMPLDTPLIYRSTDSATGSVATAMVTVSSNGQAWLKDPARPWATIGMLNCAPVIPFGCVAPDEPAVSLVGAGLGTETYAADANLFPILNAPHPADVYALRKDATTSWRVVSHTLLAQNTLRDFYAPGGPIFIQLDPVYGWPDRYYQPMNIDVSRLSIDLTRPQRFWDVPLVTVDAPVGPAQGTCEANWCIIDDTYATYALLAANGLTWGDVMEGDAASC